MALLYAMNSLRDELHLTLHGAHLDHTLRGEASANDAQFVREQFSQLGIEATVESADVAAHRQANRMSLEQAAREVRYSFLTRVARQQGAVAVALGHTADDQAESVLMHMLRGSGLTGLKGMQPVSRRDAGDEHTLLVRPLLEVTRGQTEAYCLAMGLEPRRDETNDLPDMTRNRVRAELLPVLESFNPSVKPALVRLAKNASLDMDYISQQVDAVWDQICESDSGGVSINLTVFRVLHPAIMRHLLRRALLNVKGDLEDVEQNHLEDMARLAMGPAGKALDLPGGLSFAVGYGQATITTGKQHLAHAGGMNGCHKLAVSGETILPGWRVQIGPETGVDKGRPSDFVACLSASTLADGAWVRSRRPGDRFQPLGMAHRKKLQDFMVDSKIPRGLRDDVPLLVTPRGIAWVVGWRIADWAKAGDKANDRVVVKFTPSG